ncbi:hypothetical protein BaRGS_00016286 [Batillaria attramentaria]|uniref:Tetraspanin n=1 Tax=Batillaria attramentaria TaxID=370345 RepID=A0ABD0KYN9_9CAEN
MGVCTGFSQCALVVINAIFADFYGALQKLIENSGSHSSLSNFNIGDYLESATLAFILLGVFFFLLGIVGCIGACCKVKCFLVLYAVVIGIIIVGEIVFVVLLFTIRDTLEDTLRSPLYESLENSYEGLNSSTAISLGWNFFKCCGVENYTDFEKATKWQQHRNYSIGNVTYELKVPIACCKLNGSFPDVKGCYNALMDFLLDNSDIMIGVGAAVAAVEVLMFIFAICVCHAANRKNIDEVEPW